MDMRDMAQPREVVSEVPNDLEHPKMYEWTFYILGIIAALCVLGLFVLAFTERSAEAVTTGLVAVASMAVGGLVRMFSPKA